MTHVSPAGPPARILALATSLDPCSVALFNAVDGSMILRQATPGMQNSGAILELVDAVLAAGKVSLGDLGAIAFESGPGSFTGLRIGCAVAQGLGYGADLPLLAVGSLHAIAVCAPPDSLVFVAIDARMNECYCAVYRTDEQGMAFELDEAAVLSSDEVVRRFDASLETRARDERGNRVLMAASGNGFERFPVLSKWAQSDHGVHCVLDTVAHARADRIASIAHAMWLTGSSMDPALAAPVYVRDKVALEKSEQHKST